MYCKRWLVCCSCCRDTSLRHRKQSCSVDCRGTETAGTGNAHISRERPRSLGQDCRVYTLQVQKGLHEAIQGPFSVWFSSYVMHNEHNSSSSMLFAADLNSLASREEDICRKFVYDITRSTSCLCHLSPDPKLPSHNSRLRSYETFPRLYTCTKRYCSFVHYALIHYQDRVNND